MGSASKYITRRKSRIKQFWGEEKAKENPADYPSRTCPHCGNQAAALEVQKDRITYQCENCRAKNTYTRVPDGRKEVRGQTNKLGLVTLRNKKQRNDVEKMEEEAKDTSEDKAEIVPEDLKVETIRTGMANGKVLSFEYRDRNGQKSFRTIEPYKIAKDKKGNIVLYGFCLEKNGIRMFKLPKIAKLAEQPYDYKPRWPVEDLL